MSGQSGIAVLARHPRAAADARCVLGRIAPGDGTGTDMAALLLTEVVSNAVRHSTGPAIEVAVDYDRSAGVITGAVFDADPHMGGGARAGRDETGDEAADVEMETGRGLDLLDAVAGAWGVATVGGRGKWVWFQVHAA